MNLKDYIENRIRAVDLELLYEATGPDAWSDPRTIVREIATAINNGDAEALMLAMRDPFLSYMAMAADLNCIVFDEDIDEDYEPDAAHASSIIDHDNAAEINSHIDK